MSWLRRIALAAATIIAFLFTVWAAAVLYFDAPSPLLRTPAAVVYLIAVLAGLWFLRRGNLLVGVAKEMGADFTLGIYLKTAPLKPDADLSSFAVLGQSIATVIAANERRSLEEADLVMYVNLQKFTAMDYNQDKAIIEAGYAAAEANAAKLLRLSVDEATWNQYLAERGARPKQETTPQFVTVTGVSPQIANSIADEMSGLVGKPVNTDDLNEDITRLTGMGALSSLNYSMVERNGTQGLEVQAATKPYSPPIVRPLVLIDGSDYNQVFFSVGARTTFLDFGGYRRELRNDVILGPQYGINSEYYRPFSATSKWFVAPRTGFNSAQYPSYQNNTLLALYRNRAALGGLDLGYVFGRTGELRLGYEGGYQHLSPQVGAKDLPTLSGATGDVKLQYTLVCSLSIKDAPVNQDQLSHRSLGSLRWRLREFCPSGGRLAGLKNRGSFPHENWNRRQNHRSYLQP